MKQPWALGAAPWPLLGCSLGTREQLGRPWEFMDAADHLVFVFSSLLVHVCVCAGLRVLQQEEQVCKTEMQVVLTGSSCICKCQQSLCCTLWQSLCFEINTNLFIGATSPTHPSYRQSFTERAI